MSEEAAENGPGQSTPQDHSQENMLFMMESDQIKAHKTMKQLVK